MPGLTNLTHINLNYTGTNQGLYCPSFLLEASSRLGLQIAYYLLVFAEGLGSETLVLENRLSPTSKSRWILFLIQKPMVWADSASIPLCSVI